MLTLALFNATFSRYEKSKLGIRTIEETYDERDSSLFGVAGLQPALLDRGLQDVIGLSEVQVARGVALTQTVADYLAMAAL